MYIDVHAHMTDKAFSETDRVMSAIKAAGVGMVVCSGYDLETSFASRDFAEKYDFVYFSAGFQPQELAKYRAGDLERLRPLLRHEKCLAVGEIGLDYHYPEPPKEVQREVFVKQILLAERAGLPLVVHSRDCAADMLALLTEMRAHLGRGFLMHCYSHGAQMLPAFAALGAYFSFGGVACFRNAKNVWESVRACPAERILSETDSPYLSPFRGEKNTPANIPVIVKQLAQLRGEREEELQEIIMENAKRIFAKMR